MEWNFDITQIPKSYFQDITRKIGKRMAIVEVLVEKRVILATKCGKVTLSHWLPPELRRPIGRWNMLTVGEEPVAWMPWPEYPNV